MNVNLPATDVLTSGLFWFVLVLVVVLSLVALGLARVRRWIQARAALHPAALWVLPRQREPAPTERATMDAIVMLREDHKQAEQMFKLLEKDDLSVVPDICAALTVHAQIEEEIFYPVVRAEVEDAQDDIGEAVQEHHLVKILISELQSLTPDDVEYRSKAIVLMELVRHHVEEEEGELFPDVRSALGRNRLQELGAVMQERRAELVGATA